jgi:hypothetical protein
MSVPSQWKHSTKALAKLETRINDSNEKLQEMKAQREIGTKSCDNVQRIWLIQISPKLRATVSAEVSGLIPFRGVRNLM